MKKKDKKEKQRKKLRWFKWMLLLPLFAALLFLGLHTARTGIWHHWNTHSAYTAFSKVEQQYFSKKQERFGNKTENRSNQQYGEQNEKHHDKYGHEGRKMERKHHEELDGIFFVPFLLDLVLVILGWTLLRKSEGNTAKKWTSILLLVIGLLPLLPIFILVAGMNWLYKRYKYGRETIYWGADENLDAFTTLSHSGPGQLLDEWEQKIRKEEL